MKAALHSPSFFRGLAVVLLTAAGPRLFPQDSAEAWNRAKEAWARSKDLMPGKMRMLSSELDRAGKPVVVTEELYSIRYAANGKSDAVLVSASKDGKDVTETRRAELEKQRKKNGPGGESQDMDIPDPLALEPHKSLKLGAAEAVEIDGVPAWKYPFKVKTSKLLTSSGFVLVNRYTFMPIAMEYTFDPMPAGVKKADMKVFYGVESGTPVAGRVTMNVDANLIFFKKKMDILMEFSDYAKTSAALAPATVAGDAADGQGKGAP